MAQAAQSSQPAASKPSITVRPLSPAIGAEIIGLDLSKPINPAIFETVRQAWYDHNILLFRNQKITSEEQIRFAENFGPLAKRVSGSKNATDTPIMLISNVKENGKFIGDLPDGEMWFHSDQCYSEKPAAGSMLYAIEIPSKGGNTIFANCYASYETLPEETKKRLTGLKAVNVYDYYANPTKRTQSDGASAVTYTHPVVRTHPATGRKALYVNRLMTSHIEGMPRDESDKILNSLYDLQEERRFVYEHEWRVGDVLIWDNRCSLHARTDFDPNERRLLRRLTMLGDKPF